MKTLYLDMDGVLCDFIAGLLRAHRRFDLLEQHKEHKFPNTWNVEGALGGMEELWAPVNSMGYEFWVDLDPLPYMREVVNAVESTGIEWYIATSPGWWASSYKGKKMWLQRHLPIAHKDRTILIKDKALLANPNTFLVDDCDANIAKFHHNSGKVFTFPQLWNEARSCIGQEVELLKIALEDFTYSPLQIPTYVPEAVYV